MHNDYEYGCKRKGLCDSGHFEYSHRAFFVIIISLWLGVVVFLRFFLNQRGVANSVPFVRLCECVQI